MWLKEVNMKLLKFSSESCLPCKALSKTLNELIVPFPVQEVNVDSDSEMTRMYKVRSVPTLILVDQEGGVVSVKAGAVPKDALAQWLKSFS